MTTTDPLISHFAASRPEEMARVISNYDSRDSAEIIASLPPATGAGVCTNISSRALTALLDTLEPSIIGEMLIAADHAGAITLVAHLHEHRYAAILDAMEESRRSTLRRLFEYPEQTLSALASPQFMRVAEGTTCESVASELIASQSATELPIFVVDLQGKYAGILNTQVVIAKHNHAKRVSRFMKRLEPLSGDMSVSSALTASQWMSASALPVVNAQRQIIGAVTLEELSRIAGTADGEDRHGLEVVFSELAMRYFELCAGIVSLIFTNERNGTD